jgi:hypothetical protein
VVLQRVTEGLGKEFRDIEKALPTEFLQALFADDIPGRLASLPVKKAGLAIQDPTTSVDSNWTASTVICGHLIVAIRGREEFRSADHTAIMAAGKAETQMRHLSESQEKLDSILYELPGEV